MQKEGCCFRQTARLGVRRREETAEDNVWSFSSGVCVCVVWLAYHIEAFGMEEEHSVRQELAWKRRNKVRDKA